MGRDLPLEKWTPALSLLAIDTSLTRMLESGDLIGCQIRC